MKVAIPTREGVVDDHFGHCHHYTVYEVENGALVDMEEIPAPQGCGCKSGIAQLLAARGVEVMLAGNMGDGAKNVLTKCGIKVIRGCSGDISRVIIDYLWGNIEDSGEHCDHRDCPTTKSDYTGLKMEL